MLSLITNHTCGCLSHYISFVGYLLTKISLILCSWYNSYPTRDLILWEALVRGGLADSARPFHMGERERELVRCPGVVPFRVRPCRVNLAWRGNSSLRLDHWHFDVLLNWHAWDYGRVGKYPVKTTIHSFTNARVGMIIACYFSLCRFVCSNTWILYLIRKQLDC